MRAKQTVENNEKKKFWEERDEQWKHLQSISQNAIKRIWPFGAGDEKDKKVEGNKKAAKAFIREGKQTLQRLKKAGAEKEHLDSLEELIGLYEKELKNKESGIDWGADDAVDTFKKTVVNEKEQDKITEDLFYLRKQYPAEDQMLDQLTNWLDWGMVTIVPMKPVVLQVQHSLPEPVQLTPIALIPYGSDLTIKTDLSDEQKIRYDWDNAVEMFKKENPNVEEDTLYMWIRKQMINGWTTSDDVVPNIRAVEITPVTYYWMKKPFEVWHIKAYSYDDAYRTATDENYKGFWYWITPIYEEKGSSIQKYGAISEHNNTYFNGLDQKGQEDLFNKLKEVSGDETLYNNAVNERPLGNNFIALVKSAQEKFWPGNRKLVNGILTPDTLDKLSQKVEQNAQEKTISYKDDKKTLITKLYYVSGKLDLYQAAMKEEIVNQQPGPTQQSDAAFRNLVRSAQEVFFGRAFFMDGSMDSKTYQEVDKWGKLYGGNVQAMDDGRVYRFVQREYDSFEPRRQEIRTKIEQLNIKINEQNNNQNQNKNGGYVFNPDTNEVLKLQMELDSYSWSALVQKYNSLRIFSSDYTYLSGNNPVQHDESVYPLSNPFIDPNAPATNSTSTYLSGPVLFPVVNPDVQKENQQFYSSFSNAPRNAINEQTNQMRFQSLISRQELLKDPSLSTKKQTLLYNQLVLAYGSSVNNMGDTLPGESVETSDVSLISIKNSPQGIDRPGQVPQYNNATSVESMQEQTNTAEFGQLCTAVSNKVNTLKNEPDSNSYKFFSNILQLFSMYKDSDALKSLHELKKENSNTYYASDLLDIAGELVDMEITKTLLPKGSIEANNLKNRNERRNYLEDMSLVTGNAATVPTYLLIDEVAKDNNTYLSDPKNRPLTKTENNLVHDGIPLNAFYKYENYVHHLWVDLGDRGMKEETLTDFNHSYSRDNAINTLFDQMENNNYFPNGKIWFTKDDGTYDTVETSGDHWTWSEILTAISLGLAILAIPFTLGGSTVIAGYLTLASIATGIIAQGVGLYEKWEAGTLTAEDAAITGLSILALLLPGAGLFGKLTKLSKVGGSLAFLEGETFLATTYRVGIADGLVQGYTLTDNFIKQYENLPTNLSPEEREKKVMELLLTSLAYGLITFHSVHGDFKNLDDLGNMEKPTIRQEPTENNKEFYDKVKASGFQQELPDANIKGSTYENNANANTQFNKNASIENNPLAQYSNYANSGATKLKSGATYNEYSVTNTSTGVTTKYTKQEFTNLVESGKLDGTGSVINAPRTDLTTQKTVNAYNSRNKSTPLVEVDHGAFNKNETNLNTTQNETGMREGQGTSPDQGVGGDTHESNTTNPDNGVNGPVIEGPNQKPQEGGGSPTNNVNADKGNLSSGGMPPYTINDPEAPIIQHSNGKRYTSYGGQDFEWNELTQKWDPCENGLYNEALKNQSKNNQPVNENAHIEEKDNSKNNQDANEGNIDKNSNLDENNGSLNTGKKTVEEILDGNTKIDDLETPPDGYIFFTRNGRKYIKRIDKNSNLKRLTVNEEGIIVEYKGASRVSKPGQLRKNLGPAPDNHQAHHIVPDNVVKNSPIHQEARERGLYDIDRKSNGEYLAETGEDMIEGQSDQFPTHSGSHPEYDSKCREVVEKYKNKLEKEYGSLKDVPDEVLENVLLDIEDETMEILENWKNDKLD